MDDPLLTLHFNYLSDVRGKNKMSFSGKGIEMQEMSPFSDRIKDTSRKRYVQTMTSIFQNFHSTSVIFSWDLPTDSEATKLEFL